MFGDELERRFRSTPLGLYVDEEEDICDHGT